MSDYRWPAPSWTSSAALLLSVLLAGCATACVTSPPQSDDADTPEAPAPRHSRPNILLLTFDDLNWDSLGVTGCPLQDISPHVDELAAQGKLFLRAYVNVAICHPTRATWMTGLYPHHHGTLSHEPMRVGVETLPELLRENGYFTGILGKVSHVVPERPDAWDAAVRGPEMHRDPGLYLERTLELIDRATRAGKPFFLNVNVHDPHRPFNDPSRSFAEPPRRYTPEEVPVPPFLPDLRRVRQELAEYYASVRRADETAGAVLRGLRESGAEATTLVLTLADNGMPFPFAKTNCYDQSTRTPMIVRWPGITTAATTDDRHFVSGVDLMPTLLEAAGIDIPPGLDGSSFFPLLAGAHQDGRDSVLTAIYRVGEAEYPMRALRDERWLYIYNAWSDGSRMFTSESSSTPSMRAMERAARTDSALAARLDLLVRRVPEELYDVEQDPHALENVAGIDEYQAILATMRARLLGALRDTGDPLTRRFAGFVDASTETAPK